MAEEFISLLDRIRPQDEEVKEYLRTHITTAVYPKGHILVRIGQVNDRLYFIRRGAARAYELRGGMPVTTWFMFEGDMAMLPESFYDGTPSHEAIELFKESEICTLHKEHMDYLYERYMCANYVGRVIEQKSHVQVVKQFREVRVFSKEERYLALLDRWPDLFARAHLQDIASFLGMHRKTLTRIRSGMARKK